MLGNWRCKLKLWTIFRAPDEVYSDLGCCLPLSATCRTCPHPQRHASSAHGSGGRCRRRLPWSAPSESALQGLTLQQRPGRAGGGTCWPQGCQTTAQTAAAAEGPAQTALWNQRNISVMNARLELHTGEHDSYYTNTETSLWFVAVMI